MFNIDRDLGNSLYLAYKGMPPKTEKEALLLSIEKWQFISNYYESGKTELLSDGGMSTCGCCILFFSNGKSFCEDCPIYNKTRKQYCYDTPYDGYANSTPVIVPRIGGSAELVEDGVTGYIFEPGSRAGLIEALEKSYQSKDKYHWMAKKGRAMVEEWSTEKYVENLMQLL